MNYAIHYDRLIVRARGRVLTGYRERHHVLPRCIGGGNEHENIVELTPEEHYVAHQLLVKLFPVHGGLAYAAMKMAKKATGRRPYGWLRRRCSEARRGTIASPETRAKQSAAKMGHKFWVGRKHSPETRAKMSVAMAGNRIAACNSPESKARRSASQMGNKKATGNTNMLGHKHTPETRAKMSATRTGTKASVETRAKLSAMQRLREKATPETRAKMSGSATCRDHLRQRDERGRYGSHSPAPNPA